MSRLSIKPSLKRIDPEEKKWCPSRREMASLQSSLLDYYRLIKLSLLDYYRLIKASLRTIHPAEVKWRCSTTVT
ncbi:unnamed protein product [Cylindrotheca closterium]|uniref:Uncharacterized protein n=1 Tax=Cylindrotheca closterium TaxID=2856 RepID=A0AAD2GER8_9STRA|nr:unnamed protein product [Cylindrotheca closterium]